uniref:Putative secreted protein n=1 Tax=Anopheles triannulatus TaxID=58253 RepID=A0A2M4B2B8_9DIPT
MPLVVVLAIMAVAPALTHTISSALRMATSPWCHRVVRVPRSTPRLWAMWFWGRRSCGLPRVRTPSGRTWRWSGGRD